MHEPGAPAAVPHRPTLGLKTSTSRRLTTSKYISINILTRKVSVSVCVCLSVTDVTHFRNVYSGNEATTCTVTLTLGTSPLSMTSVSCIAP